MAGPLAHRRVVAGVQARLSSTRLPGKVLADVAGKPLIQRVVERTRAARLVDEVIVLTSEEPSDDPLAQAMDELGIPCRRGSLPDVLSRYGALLQDYGPEYVVRVTGDCPLVESSFIDAQLEALIAFDADFTWIAPGGIEGTLCGQGALSARALERALSSTDPRDREHVGGFFFQRERASFRHVELLVDPLYRRAGLRLAVDEPADLELVRAVFAALDRPDERFSLADAIRWLDRHPKVRAGNAEVVESSANREVQAKKRNAPAELVGRWPR